MGLKVKSEMRKYSVVDLFAGAGGLSLGFLQTGHYDIKAAFENSPYMQDTYRKNHPGVDVQGDVCAADYKVIQKKYGPIDVVIGGPPCQGFSNANRQRNHAINQNNILVKQYMRAIIELCPKAFVMENVSSLKSELHRFYMEKKDRQMVEEYGIPSKKSCLYLLSREQLFDGALEIVQSNELVLKYLWPENDYFELNVVYKTINNKEKMQSVLEKHKNNLLKIADQYIDVDNDDHIIKQSTKAFTAIKDYFENGLSLIDLQSYIEPAIMIQRMLSKAKEIFDNDIEVDSFNTDNGLYASISSFSVLDYISHILENYGNGYTIRKSVLCAADYGAPQKRKRFVLIGVRKDISTEIELPKAKCGENDYHTVRDAISDLENIEPLFDVKDDVNGIPIELDNKCGELCHLLRDSEVLHNHIVTKTTDTAMERFKALHPGENFHSLSDELKTNTYSNVSRTQNTIYLRLNYDEPSGTVVNVRKSMWIHPTLDRSISIREAARLQTFPDSFVFCGSKDKQYQQVGNAVPPIMAKAIAETLAETLINAESKE